MADYKMNTFSKRKIDLVINLWESSSCFGSRRADRQPSAGATDTYGNVEVSGPSPSVPRRHRTIREDTPRTFARKLSNKNYNRIIVGKKTRFEFSNSRCVYILSIFNDDPGCSFSNLSGACGNALAARVRNSKL